MKGRFYFWGFAIIFTLLAQLLVYYANPTNFPILEAILTKPLVLAYNIIIFVLVVALLIWLFLQIRMEDKHEKEANRKEQGKKDRKLVKAFKQAMLKALEEDREKGAK